MKHLILFENYFNRINEAVENMKSGAKLYIDEEKSEFSPGEMISTLGKVNGKSKASILYSVSGNKRVLLTFTDNLGITYKTKSGFGTPVLKEGGQEVKGAGIVYQKIEGDEILNIPYKGMSDDDFSKALGLFMLGSGGLQNFKIAEMAVNTIYELVKTYKDKTPESLKRAYIQLERAIKLQDVNILAGTTENEKTLNKKLKSSLKAFVAKLA